MTKNKSKELEEKTDSGEKRPVMKERTRKRRRTSENSSTGVSESDKKIKKLKKQNRRNGNKMEKKGNKAEGRAKSATQINNIGDPNRTIASSLLSQSVLRDIRAFLRSFSNSRLEVSLRYKAELDISLATNQASLSLTNGTASFFVFSPTPNPKRTYCFEKTQYRYERLTNPDLMDHCVICLCKFKGSDTIANCACSHIFHFSCLKTWLNHKTYCPICRKNLVR